MTDDSIINEVRAARDALASEHDYDLGAIFKALRSLESEHGSQVVVGKPRAPSAAAQQTVAPDDGLRSGSALPSALAGER